MYYAMFGGPCILAYQTLVVRKCRLDFDPLNEFIGKIVLRVKIFSLSIKYFMEYIVAKIGKVLGDVVKVDKLTVSQLWRCKFARVCIDVDLSKPLRLFVVVEFVVYNVVYEGTYLIYFDF